MKFHQFAGKVGSSDLEGNIDVDTRPQRPVLTASLQSKLVDLKDLGGFIGANPGSADKGTKAPARSNGKVLPDDPISLPKLNVADVHLDYRATRIQGRDQPLDNMRAKLDIVNGQVALHPLSFAVGKGTITSEIDLSSASGNAMHAKANIDFRRVDFGKLMNATGVGAGAGSISGQAVIDGTGRSLAEILGHGNGELRLFMGAGGDVSALLVDLSGLQFGNALLSALGVPSREKLMCFVADVGLKSGEATARTVLLDTDDSRVGITGGANLLTEALSLRLETQSKHFSIGTIRTPIRVVGTMGNPSIAPEVGPLAARGGAAVALGIVGTPLASLLATIELGSGEHHDCAALLAQGREPAPRR